MTCTRCAAALRPGMWECPNCRLRFPSPVPAPKRRASTWVVVCICATVSVVLVLTVGFWLASLPSEKITYVPTVSDAQVMQVSVGSSSNDVYVALGRPQMQSTGGDGNTEWYYVTTNGLAVYVISGGVVVGCRAAFNQVTNWDKQTAASMNSPILGCDDRTFWVARESAIVSAE